MRRLLPVLLCALAILVGSPTGTARAAEPKVHVVYKGQHLGMIARRYHVTVAAIQHANLLDPKDPIKPGQRLLIPPDDDPDGSETRARKQRERKGQARKEERQPRRAAEKRRPVRNDPPRTHRVAPRQHLGMIARRYHTSVDALRHANELAAGAPIHPGDQLVVPWPEDEDGSAARRYARRHPDARDEERAERAEQRPKPKRARSRSWRAYRKPAWRRGYLKLEGPNGSWRGYVIGKGNVVLGAARLAFAKVLATSDGQTTKIHPRLIRLIAKVSDTFGGRTIRVVSGYRLESTARRSRHKTGHALDFSIAGVPNEALRDYVKRFPKVGIGYYPNSSFIHLDVRDRWTYWIDYSGPGQAPRYGHITHRRPPLR